MRKRLKMIAEESIGDVVALASDLIRIPSISGDEKEVADFTVRKMRQLGFDEIRVDAAGNVIGKIKGAGDGKSVMLNCHLDTVGVGDESLWTHPPFSGEIVGNSIWGRGASDTKGAFSCQIYAAALLKKHGLLPKGDIFVTGVVHEEDSGLGSMVLLETLKTDYAVIGEATKNQIAIGNRGRIGVKIKIKGKSAHASTPELGINPHYFLAKFIGLLDTLELGEDPFFGKSSFAPTMITTSETGSNTIPAQLTLTIDFRNVFSDTPEVVVEKLQAIVEKCGPEETGVKVEIEVIKNPITCYTGLVREACEGEPAFEIKRGHEVVQKSKKSLDEAYDKDVEVIVWDFATDSGHFLEAGIPTIGFSPADARMCHTTEERIDIEMMKEGLIGYMALLSGLGS